MKVLITGASGFIGSNLVDALVVKGHSVTGLVHENNFQNSTAKSLQVDLTDSSLSIPGEKFDVVFHLAALTPMEKNKKVLRKVNLDATKNFMDKIKSKTGFLIYASGMGVFGDTEGVIIDENTPLKPHTKYAEIRYEAQKFLEKECKENSIPLTVVYFGEVYGNGGWFTSQIIERLKRGKFKLPKGGDYYRSVIHVEDAVSALIAIAEKKAQSDSFVITDSNPVLFKDFINFTCDKLGVKHPGSVPTFLVKAVLGGDFVKLLTTPVKTSNAKISKLFDFKYSSYRDGIQQVISKL